MPGRAATAAPTGTGELYPHDDPQLAQAIANAGKGSLLDSRWELAKDSKLGIFNFRAYKPVYLLPAFWSSDPNETPTSPNPNNTVPGPIPVDSLEAKFQLSFKTKAWENIFGDNGDLWLVVEIFEALAHLEVDREQFESALALYGAAKAMRDESGTNVNPSEQADYDHAIALATSAIGAERFAELIEAGRSVNVEDLVEQLLIPES